MQSWPRIARYPLTDLNKQEPPASSGHIMYILAWVAFFFIWFGIFYLYQNPGASEVKNLHGELLIPADRQGHYHVSGTINDKPVSFMLDTGATIVAIPSNLAEQIPLEGQYPVSIETASGQVSGMLTRVDKLSFGPFELRNVKAVIVPGDKQVVLMGMNVLKEFRINQEKGRLLIKY